MTDRPPFADLHEDLRAVARRLLSGSPGDQLWSQMAEVGWLGLEVPEDLGGSGATFAETAVVLEELGRAATASPLLGTTLGVAAALAVEPNSQRDTLLADIASGAARVAVATVAHADAVVAATPFTLDAGELSGRADSVVDAPGADHLLVVAMSADGPVLVHLRPDQVQVTDRPVLDVTRSLGRVEASGTIVDPADVWPLIGDAPTALQHVHDRAALSVAVDALGVTEAMVDVTVNYVGARRQFDRPIGSFQAVKHRCADMAVALRVGRELLDEATLAWCHAARCAEGASGAGVTENLRSSPYPRRFQTPSERADHGAVATSRAKSFVTAAAVDVVGGAMQLHGGIGYTWESGIHSYLKRATLDRALYGSPAAHRRRIAAHLVAR